MAGALDIVLTSLAANMRRLRAKRGLTQAQLAEKADLDLRFVQKVENAQVNLSFGSFVKLAEVLGAPPSVLVKKATLKRRGPGRPRGRVGYRVSRPTNR